MRSVSTTLNALLLVLLGTVGSTAYAIGLDEAKRGGLVGETTEGYVGIVNPAAPGDVQSMVDSVNAKRRAEYQRIAKANGITLEQVETLAAKKAIGKTRPGGWVRVDGTWRQK